MGVKVGVKMGVKVGVKMGVKVGVKMGVIQGQYRVGGQHPKLLSSQRRWLNFLREAHNYLL